MKEIPLTRGKVALVDDQDWERLSHWKWYAAHSRKQWYAERKTSRSTPGGRYTIHMHRAILELARDELGPDHIDGNGLNNQRDNLRQASRSQNSANRGKQRNNTSGYKGVWFHKQTQRWIAQCNGKKLGSFSTPEEAARKYDEAAREDFGEFACPNF